MDIIQPLESGDRTTEKAVVTLKLKGGLARVAALVLPRKVGELERLAESVDLMRSTLLTRGPCTGGLVGLAVDSTSSLPCGIVVALTTEESDFCESFGDGALRVCFGDPVGVSFQPVAHPIQLCLFFCLSLCCLLLMLARHVQCRI